MIGTSIQYRVCGYRLINNAEKDTKQLEKIKKRATNMVTNRTAIQKKRNQTRTLKEGKKYVEEKQQIEEIMNNMDQVKTVLLLSISQKENKTKNKQIKQNKSKEIHSTSRTNRKSFLHNTVLNHDAILDLETPYITKRSCKVSQRKDVCPLMFYF